jgi:hypothetical protein
METRMIDNTNLLIKEKELENNREIEEISVIHSKEEPPHDDNKINDNQTELTEENFSMKEDIKDQPEIDNKILIPFLHSLATEIENGTISETNKRLVGELYMTLHFKNELKNNTISENDMSKFLVLGWYIYTSILNKEDEGDDQGDDEGDDEISDDVLDKYIETYINSVD